MPELIWEHAVEVEDADVVYAPRTWGEMRADGTWSGWLEFQPIRGGGTVLRTGQETSQPSRDALVYWASGLEPIYFEGALDRAFAVART